MHQHGGSTQATPLRSVPSEAQIHDPESDKGEVNSDSGSAVNTPFNRTLISPKFMKQLHDKVRSASPSMERSTDNLHINLSQTNYQQKDYLAASKTSSHKESANFLSISDVNHFQVHSPKFGGGGGTSEKLTDPMRDSQISPQSPDILMSQPSEDGKSLKQKSKDRDDKKLPSFSRLFIKVGPGSQSPKSSKMISKPVTEQSSAKVIDLIFDKAYGLYQDEERVKHKPYETRTPRFTQVLQKHMRAKRRPEAESFLSILNKIAYAEKSRIQKLRSLIKATKTLLKEKFNSFKPKFLRLFKAIHPDSYFLLGWEFVLMILVFMDFILLPFSLAFEEDLKDDGGALDIIENMQMSLFLVDIFINFHIAYYDDGNIVFSHRKIFRSYFMKFFWVDVVSCFPYRWIEYLITEGTSEDYSQHNPTIATTFRVLRFMRVLRLIRIIKLNRIKRHLEQSDYFGPIVMGILNLMKLSLIIASLAHWVACVWYFLGQSSPGNTWLIKAELKDETLDEKYVASLYFTITTMLTVGYGDLGPVNLRERVFTIFLMILGGGMFGFTMNSIANILQSLEGEKSKRKKKINAMILYMERKGLQKDIQERVKQYMKFVLENDDGEEDQYLLSLLSNNLREEISKQINGKFLNENAVFQEMCSKKIKDMIHLYLEERTLAPHEVVYSEHDPEIAFYFITKGKMMLYYERFHRPLVRLQKGAYFGQISFFTDDPEEIQAKSIEFGQLIYITRTKFQKLLNNSPSDKETFAMIKDKIKLYGDYSDLQLHCYICEDETHVTTSCPKGHYNVNKSETIKNFIRHEKEFAKGFLRRFKRSKHTLMNLNNLQKKAYKFQLEISTGKRKETDDILSVDFESLTKKKASLRQTFEESEGSPPPSQRVTTVAEVNMNMHSFGKKAPLTVNEVDLLHNMHNHEILENNGDDKKRFQESKTKSQRSLLTNLEDENEEQIIFDKVKNYEIYFPHNNISKMLEKINRKFNKKPRFEFDIMNQNNVFTRRSDKKRTTKMGKNLRIAIGPLRKVSLNPFHGKAKDLVTSAKLPQVSDFAD